MHHTFAYWHARTIHWHRLILELAVMCIVVAFIVVPSAVAMRLQDRSLYMNSTLPSATTFYRVGFSYMSPDPVGSVELLFCVDPIPYHPCETPRGLDITNVSLGEQGGETGFSLSQRTTKRLLLTRSPEAPSDDRRSFYTLENIVNSVDTTQAFAIRIKTFTSSDGSGQQLDFGSVRGQITEGVVIQTQVPPMLIFCLAQEVQDNCAGDNEVYYSDMGQLDPKQTLTAQSEMAVGTNASGGFAIIANGTTLSAGTSVIDALESPTESQPGVNQFGINLVENTTPQIGRNPEGEWTNAVTADMYGQPDKYTFRSGDVVAYSPNVSLMKKFTVSYIVNSSSNLRAGVYTTTVNYLATGRF